MERILKAKLVVILIVLTSVEFVYSECCCNSCRKVKNNNGGGKKSSGSKKGSTPKRIPGSLGNGLGNRDLNKKNKEVPASKILSNTKKSDHIKEIINDKNSGSKLPAKNPAAKESVDLNFNDFDFGDPFCNTGPNVTIGKPKIDFTDIKKHGKESKDMYPSDFKLDELNSNSKGKASPEHEEDKTITEDEKSKYVKAELQKYMNDFVTPGFNWSCGSLLNDCDLFSSNLMIHIRFVDNINELYNKIKKNECGATDFIKGIGIELWHFYVVCDQDGDFVKYDYPLDDFPKTISNLKDCLNKGMSNEIICKNWYFLPVNGYFGNNYYNFYICLNNGKIYSIVESKSSKLQYLSPVSIYKSPDTKGFVTNVVKTGVYRNGRFHDISGSKDIELVDQGSASSNFEKINTTFSAFGTISKLKCRLL